MSVDVETDMRAFEGALGERWCHIARPDGPNYCGAAARAGGARLHEGDTQTERCSGCGLRNCPDCVRLCNEAEGPL